MADDSSYAAFLNKANADLSSSSSPSSHQKKASSEAHSKTSTTTTTNIPAPLKSIVHNDSHTYTSDTDSQWEPVSIVYPSSSSSGSSSASAAQSSLSAEEFKRAVSTAAEVEELQVSDFDPQRQYGRVIDAVKEAAGGSGAKGDDQPQVKIFRVQVDRTRVEYYVVAVSSAQAATTADKELVGVVAKAVES